MASSYNIEPQPTGKVLLKISSGDVLIELWAKECPLASRNFLQLCLDEYYTSTIFHRLIPGFIIQGGDPTSTGHGGEAIYDGGLFADEFSSRLRFNRRGLVGMANSGRRDDNGSQFFFTLGETPELTGKNTMFGRVVGDTLYNVMKMGQLELEDVEGSERPLYPPKILGSEILVNPFDDMKKREVKVSTAGREEKKMVKKKKPKGKQMLSFADGEEEDAAPVVTKKKFDPRFVSKPLDVEELPTVEVKAKAPEPIPKPSKAPAARAPSRSPSRSPEPKKDELDVMKEKIEEVRASLKRRATPPPEEKPAKQKQSSLLALQASMLPSTSIPARKRKRGGNNVDTAYENSLLEAMSKFKSKLKDAAKNTAQEEEGAIDAMDLDNDTKAESGGIDPDADEQTFCDLHFIPNCKSCNWHETAEGQEEEDNDGSWLSHKLTFERDRLGKDLTWKRKNEEELVVIDTREKAKEVLQDERKRKDERREKGGRTSAFKPDGHHRGHRDRDRDRNRRDGDRDRERDRR
ncbi:Peptidyl-prolyl isomerase cwc27 [Orbilia ellipsospora]|uniref:Peptidyl-prolyl isomerase cwc27 n=1 Tax=Orbilia ellipsospora TaxID=2528407 RepID=A0AAV9WZA8_9PEZI